MTIDGAIEMLGGYVYEEQPCPVGLFDEAIKLGIEALQEVKKARYGNPALDGELLRGETFE